VAICGYCIGAYWCLVMVIILVTIGGYCIGAYFVSGCWWLLMVIVLVTISEYSITRYWSLLTVIVAKKCPYSSFGFSCQS
jgi:hypothetical protein